MSDKFLHVRCECHHPLHFIDFDVWEWSDGETEINASYVGGQNPNFFERLQVAAKYLFGRKRLVEADMIVPKDKALELAEFLTSAAIPPKITGGE